ncbi:MAG TPA: UvrD-helicase domain-containing protein [Caldimonas sp.]
MADAVPIPDLRAREQALAPSRSFIVQAPAGSGKTELLIQRYLGLLATVNEPEEVVAITFTRKAAAEMRERVLEALAQVVAGKAPGSDHERRTHALARAAIGRDGARGWRITDSPARLRIQTIDSLCAALTRQMPMLSKFGSQPESVEDAGALYAEAARATVELIEAKDPAADYVERLLAHLDNNVERVEDLLIEMLRRRDHWLRHVMVKQRAGLERALVGSGVRCSIRCRRWCPCLCAPSCSPSQIIRWAIAARRCSLRSPAAMTRKLGQCSPTCC